MTPVVRRVLAAAGCRPALLVALTGSGNETDRVAVLAAGFDRHLLKPADSMERVRLLDGLA